MDPAVVVVNLRARTGLEQVDSYEGEAPAPRLTVHGDVLSLHGPDVGLEVVRVPVTPLRLADVVGHGGGAAEVGDRARLDVETLGLPAAERQHNAYRARRKYVNKIVRGHQTEPAKVTPARDRLGCRWRLIIIIIVMGECP